MEFMPRGRQEPPVHTQQPAPVAHHQAPPEKPKKKRIDWAARTVRFEVFIVVIGSALILATISLWLATGNFKNAEYKQVNTSEYQAVFLTNNQVYFGKIGDINNKFLILSDVFYIENPTSGTKIAPPQPAILITRSAS